MHPLAHSGCAMAAGTVPSANIVGYTKIKLEGPLTMIAVGFDKTGEFITGGTAMTINEAFPYDSANMVASNTPGQSDQIQIFDPDKQSYDSSLNLRTSGGGTWSLGTQPALNTFPAGTAVFYLSRKNPTALNPVFITVAGQVANDATRTKKILPGLNMIANPYPVDIPLNMVSGFGLGMQSGMVASNTPGQSDQIQIFNSEKQAYDSSLNLRTSGGGTWSLGTQPSDSVIPAGGAVWYLSRGTNPEGFDLVFNTPIP